MTGSNISIAHPHQGQLTVLGQIQRDDFVKGESHLAELEYHLAGSALLEFGKVHPAKIGRHDRRRAHVPAPNATCMFPGPSYPSSVDDGEDQLEAETQEALKNFETWRKQPYPWRLSSAFAYGYQSAVKGASLSETHQRSHRECIGTVDEEAFYAIAYGHCAGAAKLAGREVDWRDPLAR